MHPELPDCHRGSGRELEAPPSSGLPVRGRRSHVDLRGPTWTYVDLRGPTWTYVDLRGPTWIGVLRMQRQEQHYCWQPSLIPVCFGPTCCSGLVIFSEFRQKMSHEHAQETISAPGSGFPPTGLSSETSCLSNAPLMRDTRAPTPRTSQIREREDP